MRDDDILFSSLLKLDDSDEIFTAIFDHVKETQLPLITKVKWCFEVVKEDLKIDDTEDIHTFLENYLNNWVKFYELAFFSKTPIVFPKSIDFDKSIFFSYHFAEYPLLAEFLDFHSAQILVARDAFWVNQRCKRSKTINFRQQGAIHQLLNSFKNSATIFAMMDYCYDETNHRMSPFLGRHCKTPFGLVKLAQTFGYKAYLVDVINNQVQVEQIDHSTPEKMLDILNFRITSKICSGPSRWLLWPSLDRRWN